MNKKIIIWLILIFTLLILGCSNNSLEDKKAPSEFTGEIIELDIEAYSWGFNQNLQKINRGDKVRLKLTSSDGTHGVTMPDFGVYSNPISPGGEEIIEFIADKTGSFNFFCNMPCGQGHGMMQGSIVITE